MLPPGLRAGGPALPVCLRFDLAAALPSSATQALIAADCVRDPGASFFFPRIAALRHLSVASAATHSAPRADLGRSATPLSASAISPSNLPACRELRSTRPVPPPHPTPPPPPRPCHGRLCRSVGDHGLYKSFARVSDMVWCLQRNLWRGGSLFLHSHLSRLPAPARPVARRLAALCFLVRLVSRYDGARCCFSVLKQAGVGAASFPVRSSLLRALHLRTDPQPRRAGSVEAALPPPPAVISHSGPRLAPRSSCHSGACRIRLSAPAPCPSGRGFRCRRNPVWWSVVLPCRVAARLQTTQHRDTERTINGFTDASALRRVSPKCCRSALSMVSLLGLALRPPPPLPAPAAEGIGGAGKKRKK